MILEELIKGHIEDSVNSDSSYPIFVTEDEYAINKLIELYGKDKKHDKSLTQKSY